MENLVNEEQAIELNAEGKKYLDKGKIEEALIYFKKALEICSDEQKQQFFNDYSLAILELSKLLGEK